MYLTVSQGSPDEETDVPPDDKQAALPAPYIDKAPLHCSFCLKSQHEVKKLIAGPGLIFICDECVGLCVAIIAGKPLKVDEGKFKIQNIPSETLLARLKPVEHTLQGMGNQLQTMVEELRGREVSWARIGEALGVSRQSAWERFS